VLERTPNSSRSQNSQTHTTPSLRTYTIGLGTLNVQSWHGLSKDLDLTWLPYASDTALLAKEANINILGVQECRIPGSDRTYIQIGQNEAPWLLLHSGNKNVRRFTYGVGFLLDNHTASSLTGFNPISERIATISLKINLGRDLYIVNGHAPCNSSTATTSKDKDIFYEDLHKAIKKKPTNHALLMTGDYNATIASHPNLEPNVGHNAVGDHTNDNGERLISLAKLHDLQLTNTLHIPPGDSTTEKPFSYTWYSNDGITKKQLDYILLPSDTQSSICQVVQNIDTSSDHRLLRTDLVGHVQSKPKQTRSPNPAASLRHNDSHQRQHYQNLLDTICDSRELTT
jgi:exonuclease III